MVIQLIRVILYANNMQVLPRYREDELVYDVSEGSYLELYVTTTRVKVSSRVTIVNTRELGLHAGQWSFIVHPGELTNRFNLLKAQNLAPHVRKGGPITIILRAEPLDPLPRPNWWRKWIRKKPKVQYVYHLRLIVTPKGSK